MVITSHILSGFQGCILGGAIGDALGYPVEYLSLDEIRNRFGEEGVTSFYSFGSHPDGLISDDTQWTLVNAYALLDTKAGFQGGLVAALKRRAIEWYQSPENNRAPGNACLDGCKNLLEGVSWFEAGSLRAKGSGAVMRVAPFGLVYASQPTLLDEVTAISSLGTHRNPTAVAAAVVTARIIAFALQSQDADYFKQSVIEGVLPNLHPYSAALANKLKKAKDLAAVHPKEAFSILGEGWVSEEAIAGALYCVLSTSSFSEAVLRAVNTDGDSDTFGAITGNIAGALYGMDNIPSDWVRIVEKSGELFRVGNNLYTLALDVGRMKASPEMTIVHDPKWHVFPEIRRALKEMAASLKVFDLREKEALADKKRHYKKDVWLDPHSRTGSVYITREIMEKLIQSGQAKREEFSPLDSYIEIIQLQRRLLKEKRLSHSSRMAMGIFSSMLTDPWVQEHYAASLSLWMTKYDILAPIAKAVISDEAVRTWEDQLHREYLRSRDNIATLEWAQKEIKKINPDWMKELQGLEGLKWESLPPIWRDNYEKFIFGLRDLLTPYLARFGWIPLLEEWYFAAHAKFFRAENSGSQ